MWRQNPYSLAFGRVPAQYISRPMLEEEVLGGFCANACTKQVYLICGIRGSGKTVFLTRCERTFREKDDWIVVDLNPNRNLLVSLVSKLSSVNELAELLKILLMRARLSGFPHRACNMAQCVKYRVYML